MDKLKVMLATLLLKFADVLTHLASKLNAPEFNIFDLAQMQDGSFDTFKEGMVSQDFRVRHQAANKLLSWYLLGNGQPVISDLTMAAHVLLEEFETSSGDVSNLVDCWVAQASAATDEIKAKAELDEQMIYDKLQQRKSQITDSTIK